MTKQFMSDVKIIPTTVNNNQIHTLNNEVMAVVFLL